MVTNYLFEVSPLNGACGLPGRHLMDELDMLGLETYFPMFQAGRKSHRSRL